MRRKIFNSNGSRIKFGFKTNWYYWVLRSAFNDDYYASLAYVNFYGGVVGFHTQFSNWSIVPTCTI